MTYKGYITRLPTSGGKAGFGHNKTSSVQIFEIGRNILLKQIRYTVNDMDSYKNALIKAEKWIDNYIEAKSRAKARFEEIRKH